MPKKEKPLRVGIFGGGLQGTELCILAAYAGFTTVLIDKAPAPPARMLSDDFLQLAAQDLPHDPYAIPLLADLDIIIPALENQEALFLIATWCQKRKIPFAFDAPAYAVTCSKLRSRILFQQLGIPIPESPPGFPLIAKPSEGSGSEGVSLLKNTDELQKAFPLGTDTPQWVFERFCPGPSFSLEVCGSPGNYETFSITQLSMDETFDCKRVVAPVRLEEDNRKNLESYALRVAAALQLHGLMDIEVILTNEGLRVLEIDARFPSQTPLAVYYSTGINMIERLCRCFLPAVPRRFSGVVALAQERHVICEHIICENNELRTQGEHCVTGLGELCMTHNFFGASKALVTGVQPPGAAESLHSFDARILPETWAATLFFVGLSQAEVATQRNACIHSIVCHLGLRGHIDKELPL